MTLQIAIIEDQLIESNTLKNELNVWKEEKNISLSLHIYNSGELFFKNYEVDSTLNPLVIFLDIELPKMNGIEIAKNLRHTGYTGHIIFLTAFREYVFHGYEVHALNYLLKPITHFALYPCLNDVLKDITQNSYLCKTKKEITRIPYNEIIAFSSNLHYIDILTNTNQYVQYTSLKDIYDTLPSEFIRIHRSYIVNMEHIYKLSKSALTLSNKMHLPIGRSYAAKVILAFSNYSMRLDK